MMPSVDVFVGKRLDWNDFQTNIDFFLKTFDIRYTLNGVHIMRRKNGKAVHKRRNPG